MARLKRVVLPGIAHHLTQRGNRREQVFFNADDYAAYLDLLRFYAKKSGTKILTYCLMPNHVHIVAIPDHEDGLRAMLGETHRRYTARINARNKWTGHLWQGRFGSVAMDDLHTGHALNYVMTNPVRARLVQRPEQWQWSGARAFYKGKEDPLLDLPLVDQWRATAKSIVMDRADADSFYHALRKAETVGRPIGQQDWLQEIERLSDQQLIPGKRGPKPKEAS